MENTLKQLEMLLDDTLQILDHMVVDQEYEDMLTSVKTGLLMQKQSVKEMRNASREEQQITANVIDENLHKLNEMVLKLESILLDDYQTTTEHHIERYEQLSLENQMEQTEPYHDKIDYLSAVKIRENINRMTEILLKITS